MMFKCTCTARAGMEDSAAIQESPVSDLRENAISQRRKYLPGPLFCDELKPKSSISHSFQGS